MILLKNIASLVTVNANGLPTKTGSDMRDIGEINDGAILFDESIRWVGTTLMWEKGVHAPEGETWDIIEEIDCTGMTVMPGFVDSHTHMVFAGSRSNEFARRLSGIPYSRIAAEGGGILTTVHAVQNATLDEIVDIGATLVTSAIAHGTTSVEIKSGYGLSTEAELKLLEAASMLRTETDATIFITFLGAHDVPPEYRSHPDDYVDVVVDEMLPKVKEQGLATACDVFCDVGFFSTYQAERVLSKALELGMQIKMHADEIANIGASRLAARMGAISADHLEYTSVEDMVAMRDAGTVATLLPGTAFTLRLPYPNARTMIERGLVVALASDCNPGSCFTENMQGILSLACINMGMSIEEVITASTLHGAHALRIADRAGSLEVGKRADLVLYDVSSYADVVYHFGTNHVYSVWIGGMEVA